MKKLGFILLCIVLLLPMIISCNEQPSTSAPASSGSDVSEVESGLVPHLDDETDLEGYALRILCFGGWGEDYGDIFAPADTNNEPVNDAIYNRNERIKEQYNCDIQVVYFDTQRHLLLSTIGDRIDAGDTSFDVISEASCYLQSLALNGKLLNIKNLEESSLNLEGRWWDQGGIRDLSINGFLPFLIGDISTSGHGSTYALYFNKDIAEDYQVGDIYQLVRDGKWTIDRMKEMMTAVLQEDGDGKMDVLGKDIWGATMDSYSTVAMMNGFNLPLITKNDDDMPTAMFNTETFINAWTKLYDALIDSSSVAIEEHFYNWDSPDLKKVREAFTNGYALFNQGGVNTANTDDLRNADIRYGIIPLPKLNEEQDGYYTTCSIYTPSFISIPLVCEDVAKATFVLEAMAYLGQDMVNNEYYTTTLKNKRFTDDDSPEMLDLIIHNRCFDIASVYGLDADTMLRNIVKSKENSIASQADAIKYAVDARLDEISALYRKLDNN